MSDLIRKSDVLELQRYSFGVSMLNSEEYIKVSDVDNILTAYSVDKVVEELEKIQDKAVSVKNEDISIYATGMMGKAIEIVKAGGKNE